MKKIICLMLCLICAFAFTSCRNETAEVNTEKETSAQSASDVSVTQQNKTDKQNNVGADSDSNSSSASENKTSAASKGESSSASESEAKNVSENKTKAKEKTSDTSTTTSMPSTKAQEAIPISSEEALKLLSGFYGKAYAVEEKEKQGDIQYYEVYDKHKNLYAKVEVNLKNSDTKETIEHSGEVNTFNLLV